MKVRAQTPYTFIQRYTEYESRFLIELINQTALSMDLLKGKVESEINSFDTEEQYGNPIYDEYENLKTAIPVYLYRTHFILLYSLFEKMFFELMSKAEEQVASKVKLNDLHGRGIDKYHRYTKVVLDVDIASVENEWQFIKHCQELRNNFVHNYHEYDPQKKDIKKLENAIKFFKDQVVVENEGIKILDKSFNLSFHEKYLKFILFIVSELDARFTAATRNSQQ